MKKRNFRKLLAFALTLCMLFSILPSSYPVSAATTATTYDFNGVDFNTTLKTNNLGNGASLTTSAPDGYTGSVMVGSGSTYVADVPNMMSNLDVMYDNIQAYAPNGTFAEACEAFVLSLGITQDEVDSIRNILTA